MERPGQGLGFPGCENRGAALNPPSDAPILLFGRYGPLLAAFRAKEWESKSEGNAKANRTSGRDVVRREGDARGGHHDEGGGSLRLVPRDQRKFEPTMTRGSNETDR